MVADGGTARRVWHVVPPNGGGVDRFVRDLCHHRPADWILHVSDAQCVVEWPASAVFLPLPAAMLTDLAFGAVLGRPQAVHAHSTVGAVRRMCETLCAAAGAPCVLTLHDIGFVDPAVAAFERGQRLRFARAAVARTAPSRYIVELARQALGDGAPCSLIENGVDPGSGAGPALQMAWSDPPGRCCVAVIGAIGPHKGLTALLDIAAWLPEGLRVVVIGYTADQLMPGWILPGRVWMHGAFQIDEVRTLVARYGARIAFFPPGMPESYCYALSDAWVAGLPAAVPDQGALAERVRRHGGGWCYDPRLPAPAPALAAWLAERSAAPADVAPAVAGLASVEHMTRAMNVIYQERGGEPADDAPADEATLRALAQPHLDTRFFRGELLNLQGRVDALTQALAQRDERVAELEAQASQQADSLQRESEAARRTLEALQRQHEAAQAAHDTLAQTHAQLQAEQQTLQAAHEALQRRHGALTAWLARPLRGLPVPLREALLRAGRRRLG